MSRRRGSTKTKANETKHRGKKTVQIFKLVESKPQQKKEDGLNETVGLEAGQMKSR